MAIKYGNAEIRSLEELPVAGKRVFVRVDFNVPINGETVTDDTRIRAALPTIEYLIAQNAIVMLASHLGRPKGKPDPKYTLLPAGERLAELLRREVVLPDDCVGDGVRKILKERKEGDVVLLENLRFHAEEEANDSKFAAELRNGAEVYVTDAFGSLHRGHASTDALPRMMNERGAGYLVRDELTFLTPLLEAPQRPYAAILGGAKVSDKIKVMEKFLTKVDELYIGGAMAFTFLKAMGHRVGKSLVEEDRLVQARRILEEAKTRNVRLHLPSDFQLGRSVDEPGPPKAYKGLEIPDGWMGLDIGPETVERFAKYLEKAGTIFWNGPLGLFETPPYDQGTVAVAKVLAGLSSIRVVGGGDSVAALHQAGVAQKMTHVSTGGGATLEYLEGKALPGLESLAV
ncbi:MAG: phosphoglycerate kinase [Pseudomonadota bacterium]